LGWGFGKLELITELPRKRLLLLDSDTVFTGRVIDWLQGFDEDLIVDKEDFDTAAIEVQFFSLSKLRQLDNQFEFPGYGFNTGQIVATTGCLTKQDFDGLLDWCTRTVKYPEVFKKGEQGLFNYAVLRKVQQGKLTIRRVPVMVWPGEAARAEHIQLKGLAPDGPHRQVIHWAGLGWGKRLEDMPRSEILLHFEKVYYDRIPLGAWLCRCRRAQNWMERKVITPLKVVAKRALFRSAE